jgi:hypothetical protein
VARVLLTALLLRAWSGPPSAAEGPDPAVSVPVPLDADTLEMVKAFLNIPTDQLPAKHIPKARPRPRSRAGYSSCTLKIRS